MDCFICVMIRTSSRCSKSTAGVTCPDLVRLLASTLIADMYPINMPGRYLSLTLEVTILSPSTTRSPLSTSFSKPMTPWAHEAASRHHIHINHETVFVSFINHKGMKPVPGILGNNSRPYFLVFVILDIQIIELPQIGKLVPVLLKADINPPTALMGALIKFVLKVRTISPVQSIVKIKRRYLPGSVNFSPFLFIIGLIYSSLRWHRQLTYNYHL